MKSTFAKNRTVAKNTGHDLLIMKTFSKILDEVVLIPCGLKVVVFCRPLKVANVGQCLPNSTKNILHDCVFSHTRLE